MPLDEEFGPQINSSNADLCNVSLFRVEMQLPKPCDREAGLKGGVVQPLSS